MGRTQKIIFFLIRTKEIPFLGVPLQILSRAKRGKNWFTRNRILPTLKREKIPILERNSNRRKKKNWLLPKKSTVSEPEVRKIQRI